VTLDEALPFLEHHPQEPERREVKKGYNSELDLLLDPTSMEPELMMLETW
jgi:hypothetical protein